MTNFHFRNTYFKKVVQFPGTCFWNFHFPKICFLISCSITIYSILFLVGLIQGLPYKVKRSICILVYIRTTFFSLGRFLEKLADHLCSLITKGVCTILNICSYNLLPWRWIDIWCLIEGCLCMLFYIRTKPCTNKKSTLLQHPENQSVGGLLCGYKIDIDVRGRGLFSSILIPIFQSNFTIFETVLRKFEAVPVLTFFYPTRGSVKVI